MVGGASDGLGVADDLSSEVEEPKMRSRAAWYEASRSWTDLGPEAAVGVGEGDEEVGLFNIIFGALSNESGSWLGVEEPAVDARITLG